jgi:hypothetical protein
MAHPQVRALFQLLEKEFHPLTFCARLVLPQWRPPPPPPPHTHTHTHTMNIWTHSRVDCWLQLAPLTEYMKTNATFERYIRPVQDVALTRLVQQVPAHVSVWSYARILCRMRGCVSG